MRTTSSLGQTLDTVHAPGGSAMDDSLSEFLSESTVVLQIQVEPSLTQPWRQRIPMPTDHRHPRQRAGRPPVLVIRYEAPSVPWRQFVLGATMMALLAVPSELVTPTVGATRPVPDRTAAPGFVAATSSLASAIAVLSPPALIAPVTASSLESVPVSLGPAPRVGFERDPRPTASFEVRGAMPQLVVGSSIGASITAAEEANGPDAPPLRVGPATVSLAAVGGVTPAGIVALVLDVTEEGHVSGVTVENAVDLAPAFVDAVSATARTWRYQPARREGVPVAAQVRVDVDIHGRD